MFIKAANRKWMREVWQICLLQSMVKEVWSLCHQSNLGGYRGLEGTLNKILKGFFLLSGRWKIHFLKGGCDTCLTKERSTCALASRVCRGEAVRGSNQHVRQLEEIDTRWRWKIVLVDTVGRIQYLTRKHTPWPRCWWINTSMYADYLTRCIQIMEEKLWTIFGESCFLSLRSSPLLLRRIICPPTL